MGYPSHWPLQESAETLSAAMTSPKGVVFNLRVGEVAKE